MLLVCGRLRRFARSGGASFHPFGHRRFLCCRRSQGRLAPRGSFRGMTRESLVRYGVLRLFFQHLGHDARNARLMLRLALMLPDLVNIFGTFPGAFLDLALLRRLQVDRRPVAPPKGQLQWPVLVIARRAHRGESCLFPRARIRRPALWLPCLRAWPCVLSQLSSSRASAVFLLILLKSLFAHGGVDSFS